MLTDISSLLNSPKEGWSLLQINFLEMQVAGLKSCLVYTPVQSSHQDTKSNAPDRVLFSTLLADW